MMPNRVSKCIAFLLIFVFRKECQGFRPIMAPDTDEIVKNEGEPLEIICTGRGRIFFSYPVDIDERIVTSEPQLLEEEEEEEDGLHRYIFRRPRTIHGDTGWYGCADHYFEPTIDEYYDSRIKWTYVYVRSNTSFFVEADLFESIREVQYKDVIIPCRPTSPDFEVTLEKDLEPVEIGEKVSFDPRIGFRLSNLTLKDAGYFKCAIEWNDTTQTVEYPLIVFRKLELPKPKIQDDTLHHVTRGQTLYINCTILLDADIQYAFNWSTPQQSSRVTARHYSMVEGNTREVISELTVKDVEYEDEGEYKCIIQAPFNVTNTDTKYLKIYDPDIKYINLTSVDNKKVSQRKFGDRIQWVVNVDAYPKPRYRWLNRKGEEVLGNWMDPDNAKYAINYTLSSIIFRINRLDINDMGVYTLQAANDEKLESLNFTLEVLAKPVPIIIDRAEAYYAPNRTVSMHCHVAAFPAPNVTWTFLKCPHYPAHVNSTLVELTNVTLTSQITKFESTATMNVEMSGHLTCMACNALGCDSATENILVSDGNGGFGILEPRGAVAAGDTVELVCAASVYNYSSVIRWLDENEDPIVANDRLKITREKTAFTYRSILTIDKVRKSDSMYYVCAGSPLDEENSLERVQYHLVVHEPVKPFFNDTNLNQTEITIDLGTESHKTIIMQCFVGGMPEPSVTWYKDDNILEENEQYFFLHNNQELHIRYLLEKDNGKYVCRAENRLGKKENYQLIAIKAKEIPKGLIVSIIILGLIVIGLATYFTIKIRRERRIRKELMEAGLMHFEEGALECLNPDLTVDDQAELLPYDRKWEFPRERLKIGMQLGSGAFGVVAKAEAYGICENETVTTVAVKMVRHTTDPTYVRALASELKIMVHLGKHLNVVNLLGACTKNISKRELLVIVEYCRYGNLHNYLLRNRKSFINQIDPTTGKFDPLIGVDQLNRSVSVSSANRIKYAALSFSHSLSVNSDEGPSTDLDSHGVCTSPDGGCVLSNNSIQPGWRSNYRGDYKDNNLKPICTQDLLSWAFQVARGMEYLSQRRVLHGDLAARNILLAENNVVKICDFGLAKTMYKDDNYKKKADGPLPIKWMAIESIRDRIFSTQSDVWSFGIVLWEFFTLAETPYPGMEAEKLYQKLIEGYRMEQPEYATKEVYDIMLQCWKAKPTLRPSFTDLVDDIGDLLEETVRSHYVSLNDPYMDMNSIILGEGKSDYLTMMSAPDHAALSSPAVNDYVNSPLSPDSNVNTSYICMSPSDHSETYESGIFSPRPTASKSHFDFPSPGSDSEDAVEMSPMLKKSEEDPYLKPIDVHERRAEFARQRHAAMNNNRRPLEERDRDSGYCNAPRNLHLIDVNELRNEGRRPEGENAPTKKTDYTPAIIRTADNYVNMPKQKDNLRRDVPDGFSNPSYVMMPNNHENDQTTV